MPDHEDTTAQHYAKPPIPSPFASQKQVAGIALTPDGRVLHVAAGTGALTHDPAYRIDCADRNRSTLKPHIARVRHAGGGVDSEADGEPGTCRSPTAAVHSSQPFH